jgi:hypothetical protein
MGRERRVEITPEALRSTIASVGGIEMSDRELLDVLPIVVAQRELLSTIRHLELDEQMRGSRRSGERE